MPADEGTSKHGADGLVRVRRGNTRVPEGLSVWEMGRSDDYEGKARRDYKKRTNTPPKGIDLAQATFVFVTPRRWAGGRTWAEERRAEGPWHDVRVHDADSLITWLREAPAVWAWFAELIGKPGPLHALETRWREWSSATVPAGSEGLVLAGREREQQQLLTWLERPASVLSLVADSPQEAEAFCWAALRRLSSSVREDWRQRALVVSGDEVLRRFALDKNPLLFVAHGCRLASARAASVQANGHHVLLVSNAALTHEAITLPPLDPPRAQAELERMGLAWDHAEQLIRNLGGELPGRGIPLSAIRRTLGDQRHQLPDELAPLLLVGAWTDWPDDLDAARTILGASAERLDELTRKYSGQVDSPLVRVGAAWRWASRRDAWRGLSDKLVPRDLARYEQVLATVFGASRSKYNDQLHSGLLEGLVLLAVEEGKHQKRAIDIVERLLAGSSIERWYPFRGALGLLAEAAPEVFAGWLHQAITNDTSTDPQLVHALEILAWDRPLDAIDCLARLAESEHADPGHDSALEAIHLILHPLQLHTSAEPTVRTQALESLAQRHPRTTVKVVLDWLYYPLSASERMPAVPRHRRHVPAAPPSDGHERYEAADALHEYLLQAATSDPNTWLTILPNFRKLWSDHQDRVLSQLMDLDISQPDLDRVELRQCLRELIAHLDWYTTSNPALDDSWANKLCSFHDRLAPSDSCDAVAWLFELSPTPLGVHGDGRYQAILEQRFKASVQLQRASNAEILDLSSRVGSPYALGETLGQHFPARAFELLEGDAARHRAHASEFARGLVRGLSKRQSIRQLWTEPSIEGLPESLQVEMLAEVRVGLADTVDFVESKKASFAHAYWRVAPPRHSDDAKLREHVVRAFLQAGRPWAAAASVDLPSDASSLPEALLGELADAAGQLAAAERDPDLEYAAMFLLEYLYLDEARWQDEVLRLEWVLLSHRSSRPPRALFRRLESDPDYFIQQFRLALSTHASAETDRARILCNKWTSIPGHHGHDSLDSVHLRDWVATARASARGGAVDLEEAFDVFLGRMFARSPMGTDGHWPHESIRDIFEGNIGNASLADAFVSASSPNGKAQFIDPEGDRLKANSWRETANALRVRWMHTASLLDRLAREFDRNAGFWDRINLPVDDTADLSDRLAALLDEFEAEGRSILHAKDLQEAVGPVDRRALSLNPQLAEIAPDTYVIVRPEYHKFGAPPPDWFIDDLMRRANVSYCVGLLSAAAIHGAANQQPQVFQVLVDRPHENVTIGVHRIEFFYRDRAQAFTTSTRNTYTGTMLVATPEATVFDLAEFAESCGGSDAVVEVFEDLGEEVDGKKLVLVAEQYPTPIVDLAAELLAKANHGELAAYLRQLPTPSEAAE
jgi:hypothetical protein